MLFYVISLQYIYITITVEQKCDIAKLKLTLFLSPNILFCDFFDKVKNTKVMLQEYHNEE